MRGSRNIKLAQLLIGIAICCCGANLVMAGDASGRWRGSWSSATTGHRGPLRANIRSTESGELQAVFVGRFALIVPFVYRADLTPSPYMPGHYTSSKRLPLLGTYRMHANVLGNEFQAHFSGRRDAGVFNLRRE